MGQANKFSSSSGAVEERDKLALVAVADAVGVPPRDGACGMNGSRLREGIRAWVRLDILSGPPGNTI
jgi:hypothetical protein